MRRSAKSALLTTIIMCCVAGLPTQVLAQEGGLIKPVRTGIAHEAFFGLSFEGNSGLAVGIGGAILDSSDGGKTWEKVEHDATQLALLAVDLRGDVAIAVGQSGVTLYRDESGKWVKGESNTTSRLFSVGVTAEGNAIAVGEFGTVIRTTDGGRNWEPANPDFNQFADPEKFGTGEPSLYSLTMTDDGVATLAGEFGVMMRSPDMGGSWRLLRNVDADAATIFAMHFDPSGNSFAVGQKGLLLVSGDNGESWTRCDTATEANFLGVAKGPSGEVVATGMRVMYRSLNDGTAWDPIVEGDTITDWYQSIRLNSGSGNLIAVGHSGKIIQIGG